MHRKSLNVISGPLFYGITPTWCKWLKGYYWNICFDYFNVLCRDLPSCKNLLTTCVYNNSVFWRFSPNDIYYLINVTWIWTIWAKNWNVLISRSLKSIYRQQSITINNIKYEETVLCLFFPHSVNRGRAIKNQHQNFGDNTQVNNRPSKKKYQATEYWATYQRNTPIQ